MLRKVIRKFAGIIASPDEVILLVDQNNKPIGSTTRRDVRKNHLLHRSSFIFIQNPISEKFYVQKRVMHKETFPGYYDPAPGGMILASDPSDEFGAKRELEEEMGISGVNLEFLFNMLYKSEDPLWCAVFFAKWDGELRLQKEEVEFVEMMSLEEIIRRARLESFTPDSMEILNKLIDMGKFKLKNNQQYN
ncbi:unnamed protein product [Blepharisma stoltei]|uniref:Nudix hydrolase domain-containing protein n=1 Tax=Blepharisma stoltei TaxID=1481888 RepID=A0AAU9KC33_9CILI|nr:unnamed protein product [Blepharisma stoltei]